MHGKKNSTQDGINDAPLEAPIPTLPLLNREMTAEIVDFLAPSSVLIRLPNVDPPNIEQFYTNADSNDEVEIDAICAVKASDGSWYRAKRLTEKQAYLIDNGKTDEFTLIRHLVPECRHQPAAVAQVTNTWLFTGTCRVCVEPIENGFAVEPVKKIALISHFDTTNDLYVTPPDVVQLMIDAELIETVPSELASEKMFAARFPDDEQV